MLAISENFHFSRNIGKKIFISFFLKSLTSSETLALLPDLTSQPRFNLYCNSENINFKSQRGKLKEGNNVSIFDTGKYVGRHQPCVLADMLVDTLALIFFSNTNLECEKYNQDR